jgi:NTE family protein
MTDAPSRPRPRLRQQRPFDRAGWKRVALVLQGGGALGAYQAGVYQELHEAGVEPDWISGVSIGAINASIIAGNRPDKRLERLRQFWDMVTDRKVWLYTPEGDIFRKARNATSVMMTTALGQPGFFKPRPMNPHLSLPGSRDATSYYDVQPLHDTLKTLVDFDLLNESGPIFSVGAVNVASGNFIYFDNRTDEIEPEHIMASGALPPAFPMVQIGTDHFWDGGIVSNTPLQHLLDEDQGVDTLVFQVDLFNARGPLPRDIDEVNARRKDIIYSSRTRYNTDVYRRIHTWKRRTYLALAKIPDELLTSDERALREQLSDLPDIAILHLIYQQKAYEGHAKDHEFSGTSMREHWQSGYLDTRRTLKRRDWLAVPPEGTGIVVHDVHRAE